MTETSETTIDQLLAEQKKFFETHTTKPLSFRLKQLQELEIALKQYEKKIETALWRDLHKSHEEAYFTEISIVKKEIRFHKKHLKEWMSLQKVPTPSTLYPSKSYIHHEPLGSVLIVAPWNYPLQLMLTPLIGAISAGCTAILKPSPDAPNTALVIEEMINTHFDSIYISVVQGARKTNSILFNKKFDLIFFTGSTKLGKVVMKAAAENLTPVILELGGKSPCIVDDSADLELAAKRIVWGKFLNAGQTCIAPDYLMVHKDIEAELTKFMKEAIEKMFGKNPKESKHYARIINKEAMHRLTSFLDEGNIVYGGEVDEDINYIAPSIIQLESEITPIMQEEIFGPILPILVFTEIKQVFNYIKTQEKPLAMYYFGHNKNTQLLLKQTTSGGLGINNTLLHFANPHLPFGGVGSSGIGNYHGKYSFLAFSNKRAIVKTPKWLDLPFQYPPFKYFKWIKRFL